MTKLEALNAARSKNSTLIDSMVELEEQELKEITGAGDVTPEGTPTTIIVVETVIATFVLCGKK